ncbi:MAG: mobile mystery protein A [Bacteroidia bacterium]
MFKKIIETSRLLLEQYDKKIEPFKQVENVLPERGWLFTTRSILRISLVQLGRRLNMTPQGVKELEKREAGGTISLNSLREAANAMDMKLVYGFVPKDGSLEKLIERKALEVAKEIVFRTSNTMILEDQGNSEGRLSKAIKEKAEQIKHDMPKYLWD